MNHHFCRSSCIMNDWSSLTGWNHEPVFSDSEIVFMHWCYIHSRHNGVFSQEDMDAVVIALNNYLGKGMLEHYTKHTAQVVHVIGNDVTPHLQLELKPGKPNQIRRFFHRNLYLVHSHNNPPIALPINEEQILLEIEVTVSLTTK